MRGSSRNIHRWALWCALAGMLLHALIPQGYMPVVGAGSVSVAFCPGGMLMSSADMPGMGHGMDMFTGGHGHGSLQYEQCLFGAALASAAPPAIAALPLDLPRIAMVVPRHLGAAAQARVWTLPPVRGPPVVS